MKIAIPLLFVLAFAAVPAQAGDAKAGKGKAASCHACHGPQGISSNPLWPNLAGQKEAYLVKAMRDYRSGARQDPSMGAIAKGLNDADIADLAAYFSSLPGKP